MIFIIVVSDQSGKEKKAQKKERREVFLL